MKQKMIMRSLIAAGIISGATLGGYLAQTASNVPFAAATGSPVAAATVAAVQPGARVAVPDFTSIVEEHGAAVVNISVTGKAQKTAADQVPGQDPNDPFYEFFKQFRGQMPQQQGPTHGLGSGFIVRGDGLILTNAHVVADASEVIVKLTDKREFKAKVLGIDKPSDVAVIKIEAGSNLPVVKLDRADDVKVGEWVLAIGSPFGFDNSVTSGIVSAKARALPGDSYVPFIQTDVAVNPGNSGGPLFNMKGEVIGINSQIYSRSGGYQGVSFAVPIDVALRVQDQLLKNGKVTRGRLGIGIQDVNQALAESFGLQKPTGALVSSVEKDGPAAKAGLQPGDVIVRFNDKEVAFSSQLPVLVANTAPGVVAKLEVMRKGELKRIDATVGELKSDKLASAAPDAAAEQGRLGVAVRPLSPAEQGQAGISGGLLVENATGAAASAGIQPGDVILSVNNTPVKTVEQLKQSIAKAGKRVALLVQRDDAKLYVPVDLG